MNKVVFFFLVFLLPASIPASSQNVGIGATTPTAKLEIKGDGSSSSTNAMMIKNSNGDTLVRVRNNGHINLNYRGPLTGRTLNIGGIGANFFSSDEIFSGAIFPTDTSLVLWSEFSSVDDKYVILQPQWGRVGIGTYGPQATLHVNGDVILGDGGSVISKMLKATIAKNIGTIAAGASTLQTFAITGATVGATVHVSPELALPDGFLIAYARVSAANTVEVKFINVTTAAINPASMDFYITVIE